MRAEGGQATVEWTAAVLVVALTLVGLVAVGPQVDGRSFGGFLAHHVVCAVKGGCRDGDAALARAYGRRDAALVRAHAPNLVYEPGELQLPVDYRRCRRADCAEAADDRDLDAHRTQMGERATVFTRVLRRYGRVYIQYWLYFPESKTTALGSDELWEAAWLLPQVAGIVNEAPTYPGLHRDDWESFQVRIDSDGAVWVRASSHGHYQGCKWALCRNRWFRETGWTRVSRGSHANHIPADRVIAGPPVRGSPPPPVRYRPLLPGHDLTERTTTAEGLRLIPLEAHDKRGYKPLEEDIKPPWEKDVYSDPESEES
jgi:hypothetical protein